MKRMSAPDGRTRIQRYREAMRSRGMRPVQIWIPDTRTAAFQIDAMRQCLAANAADDESDTLDWLERVSIFDDSSAG